MTSSRGNVDVIVNEFVDNFPSCPHGPALIFERFMKNAGSRKFFACSAFRDRKQCSLFQWVDDVKLNRHAKIGFKNEIPVILNHNEHYKRFLQFKKQPLSDRAICCTCGLLLLAGEISQHEEQEHEIKRRISRAALQHPTTLFVPLEDSKTYAQYLFKDSTVNFIITSLENLKSTHVLCIGVPRLHEVITVRRKKQDTKLTSLLLDLDSRYAQIYSHKKLCLYNMFNHHFFDHEGEARFLSFLKEGGNGLVLVIDPPFGGMVEPLVATLAKIEESWKATASPEKRLPLLWFFPYFMEKRVCDCMPSLKMLDYKVDYDNHSLFQSQDGKRKKGSPVRIFTNLDPVDIPLPVSDGYRFCDECQRFSSSENVHCRECQSCTSKDGTTYTHCYQCQRCVKSTRVHCSTCNRCELPSHTCGQQHGEGCYVCGAINHKRKDCPQKHSSGLRQSDCKKRVRGQIFKPKKKRRTE